MSERNRSYEKRIADLEKDNKRLEEERRRLTDDPIYFEKVAREKMGIIKDGEVIYKILSPGQKKDGNVSEEASVIIKQPEDDVEKPKAEVKPVVKAAVKTAVKTAAKPVVKAVVKPKVTSSKTSTKKSTKVVVKPKVVTVKKSSKAVTTTKVSTNSTTK